MWGGPVRSGVPAGGAVPKYYLAKIEIVGLVDELGEGAAVPSERELAARFGIARETVRQALQELLVEGRIRRRHGRATVVAGPKIVQPLSIESYTEGVRRQGRTPGRALVALESQPADPVQAGHLEIEPGAELLHLERILLSDDEPMGLESTFLPAARFPLLRTDFDPGTSLYAYIRGTGVTFHRATEHIETVLASPREADLLGTGPALPMLLLNRVSWDPQGRPIERVRSLFRGDRFSLVAELGG
ncbi:GntR family transcriptional regulator [Pseudonocardia ailaonensis]|uniref:GntR family transcriptional regulator n=2 Tax=Pseudonocardia ailaonensis TaxID=367279 RepID=A0ABN2NA97_9PSEU